MSHILNDLFSDKEFINFVQTRLPLLFQLADIECSRDGKVGMEVGSLRETILISLLVSQLGEGLVEYKIPITKAELDVRLDGEPISIKTKTGIGFGGVKASWTVDAEKARKFAENYRTECDMLLCILHWGGAGGMFYIPLEAQEEVRNILGNNKFLSLPKPGTNPRGIDYSGSALESAAMNSLSKRIPILWSKKGINYDKYKRWINLWQVDDVLAAINQEYPEALSQ